MYVQSRLVHPLRLTFPLKTASVIWTAIRTFSYCINGTDFSCAIIPYVLASNVKDIEAKQREALIMGFLRNRNKTNRLSKEFFYIKVKRT
jgi:hypothetical protein